ncbi:MAG: hypothetical protein AAGN82_10200 [Myxococcota bacterium]
MPNVIVVIGVSLVALGAYTFIGSITGSAMTLIPAMVGAVFIALGFVARRDAARKHAMHAVAVLALLGIVAGIGPLAMGGTKRFPPLMMQGTTGMMILCAVLLALCVRSFVRARTASA